MPIIKEKQFIISSVIENLAPSGLPDGEPEVTKTYPKGFFKISDEGYFLSYSEDGESGRVFSDISILENEITVKRRGALESDMHFCEGVLDKSSYSVPPYTFDAEIYTKKIRNIMKNDGGRVDIFYRMTIGGADKNVKMRIEVL